MIFIDTSAFVARHVARDQYHEAAVAFWTELASTNEPCVTSNFVIDELLTLLVRWTTARFAADRGRQIYSSDTLRILRPDEVDESSAIALLERHATRDISFTDCISFVLMRRYGIDSAFTFDQHFQAAGFAVRPSF